MTITILLFRVKIIRECYYFLKVPKLTKYPNFIQVIFCQVILLTVYRDVYKQFFIKEGKFNIFLILFLSY